ncbi:MAG: CHASE2 domain-containing protein [Verrucomicrobiales bacterium]|nr:CHASE2 domain-containing protein [Verrucomicrobiales bacterium]
MFPRREGQWTQVWVAGVTAALLALVGMLLLRSGTRPDPWAVRASYDALYAFATAPAAVEEPNLPVLLVYLDRDSYLREGQNPDASWSRSLHARLLGRLTAAGARAVVFDVVFDGPGADPAADREFARAIRANGRVVLAAELNGWQRQAGEAVEVTSLSPVLPYAPLKDAAAGWGLASLQVDEDFTVRQFFPGFADGEFPSLTESVARIAGMSAGRGEPREAKRWLRYLGPPLTVPHVSYSAALRADETPDALFRDRIVVVGARPMVTGFTQRRDEFRNPWPEPGRGVASMPAVEIHATQMLNRLKDGFLRRVPPGWEWAGVVLMALGLTAVLFPQRPAAAAGTALLLEGVLVAGVAILFLKQGLWFPWLIVATVQIPGALTGSVVFHSVEWYRQRRRMEAARRVAEAQIREQAELLDKAQDAIVVRDLSGRVTYANPAVERLTGWTPADWLSGDAAGSVFAPCPTAIRDAEKACRESGEWMGELEWATRSGERRMVQSRWTLIRDPEGRALSQLLINTDITEKKRLEAQFLRAQRLETVGSLAGGMAHDLNSALAPVLMGIQLLRRDSHDPEAVRLLEVMEENTHRGADMVRQVLLFSRGASEERAPVRPGAVLTELERMLRHSFPRGISLRAMVPPDLWTVMANPTQLHQVLLNLCVNARDAMPGGGELTLAADNVHLDAAEAAGLPQGRPGDFVMFLVSDTGEGVPPEILPRLFEPFFTTKPAGKGTGLGLSTVARIVQAHQGFLNVHSEPGAGATFEVYLPRAPVETPTPEQPRPVTAPRGTGQRILVVEDDQSVGNLLTEALRDHGYEVVAAPELTEGIQASRHNPTPVAAVLLDAAIPGASVPALVARIGAELPGAAVLLMVPAGATAIPNEGVVLQKPFELPLLFGRLADALAAKASGTPTGES